MNRLAVQFLDQGLHRAMFDAMPMPVFLVDNDASILEYNAAASQFLGAEKHLLLRRRLGDVLDCLHATESPEGCGRAEACPTCGMRNAIDSARRGRRVTRRATTFEDKNGSKFELRVGCHPFTFKGQSFNLLVLEGLND